MHGVEQTLAQSNYHLTIGNLTDTILDDPPSFRFVREGRIDGMTWLDRIFHPISF